MQQGAHHDHGRDSHGSIWVNRQVMRDNEGFISGAWDLPHGLNRTLLQNRYMSIEETRTQDRRTSK
jgi:hypothetical protein